MSKYFLWLRHFELFEVVGVAASAVIVYVFFAYGQALDKLVQEPGYHFRILFVIAGIYMHFIPWALLVGAVFLSLAAIWLRYSQRELWHRFSFGLRVFLAYCMLLIAFRVLNFYIPVIHPGLRDGVLQRMDQAVLHKQTADWLQPLAHRWLTDVLTGAYVSWFWLLFLTIVVLLLVSREAVGEYLFASLLAFYIGYFCYVLVPAVGPGYTVHFAAVLGDIAPRFTTNRLMIARDCFPSLHTAMSVLMAVYIYRYQRAWAYLYVPMAGLIIFATLYLRIHYAVDDITGAALAVVIAYLAPMAYESWRRYAESLAARHNLNWKLK